MLLDIQAEALSLAQDEGRLTLRVLLLEDWPEWIQAEQATASGLLAALGAADVGEALDDPLALLDRPAPESMN